MNNNVIAWVGWLLLVSALGFYVYGIYEAVHLSWGETPIDKDAYPAVLSSTVGSIQALLLANLGILLGISIARPDSNVAKRMLLGKQDAAEAQSPLDLRDKVQLFALVLYIFSLIACLITWIHKDFSFDSTKVVSVVPESGKMFIGVVLAYLTAVLRKPASTTD